MLEHGVRVRFQREFSSFQTASGISPTRKMFGRHALYYFDLWRMGNKNIDV
jgi:hypothetical protein